LEKEETLSMLPIKRINQNLRPRSVFDHPFFHEFFGEDDENSIFSRLLQWDERMGATDFEKTEKEYTVLVDVPGLTKDEISVNIEEGCITISAERKPREKKEGVEYLASERSYRRFERKFRLPEDVDFEKSDAKVENGVLTLVLGRKKAERSAKKVEIK
jgi:HSP20 family protein